MAMKKVAKTALRWCGADSSLVQVNSKACIQGWCILACTVWSPDAGVLGAVKQDLAHAIKCQHLRVSAENARPGAAVAERGRSWVQQGDAARDTSTSPSYVYMHIYVCVCIYKHTHFFIYMYFYFYR